MFRQECHSLAFLQEAVLRCKIFPVCLLHSPLYCKYFVAIKPYISIQATVTSGSDIRIFLTEGHKGKFLVTYCIHSCQIFTMLPSKHFNSGSDTVCEKCDVELCIS
jgi:hypothetical protein